MRVLIVLALAITAGSALAFATYNMSKNASPDAPANFPVTPVVVAKNDLPLGTELDQDDVKVVDWPAGSVPQGAISNPEEVVGRGLVMPMIQNEPILPMKLASKEAGAGLPPVIPPGLRAMSVRVNDVIGVAGYVLPGTRVDVIGTVNPGEKPTEVTSKVILTDVQVLASGTKIEQDVENNKPVAVSVVTLLVTPAESERLTLASGEGKIQLALRNPMDKDTPATSGIRAASLLGSPVPVVRQAASRKPGAAPVQNIAVVVEPATVEIIRGDKRSKEVVRQQEQ
jgi:pilus assembly protein CpaB